MMQSNTGKKRIGWIDALRGFTMILVVFSHVEISGMGMEPGYTGVNDLLRIFRMPLFFFVSGFIAYRPDESWNWGYYRGNMLKKLRVQVIPMLFFGLIYAVFYYSHSQGDGVFFPPLRVFVFSSVFSFFFFFFGLANFLTSILHHRRGGTLAKLQHPPCQKSDSRKGMSTCDTRPLGDGGVGNRSLCCLWEVGSEAEASLGSSGG